MSITQILTPIMATLFVLLLLINFLLAKRKPNYFMITMAITVAIFVYVVCTIYAFTLGINGQAVSIPLSVVALFLSYFSIKGKVIIDQERKSKNNPNN